MKVLLVNGSPHEEGCTYTALCRGGKCAERLWRGYRCHLDRATGPLSGCIVMP